MAAVSGNALTDLGLLWKRQMIRYFNNPLRIVGMLIRPLIWLLLFGVAVGSLMPKQDGYPYAVFILPGIVTMAVLGATSRGGQTILRDKSTGFLREVLVAPVSRWSILMSFCLGISTRALISAVLMLGVGLLLANGLVSDWGILLGHASLIVLVLVMLGLALVSLSIALAWLMDDIITYSTVSGWLFYPLFFLSGGLYKIRGLPTVLKVAVQANPLTYGVDAVRQLLLGPKLASFSLALDLTVVTVFSVACLAFAGWVVTRPTSTQ